MNTVIVVLAMASIAVCRSIGSDTGPRGRGYPCDMVMRPPPPPYLRNLTEEARNEYFIIVSNRTVTIAERKQGITTWAQKYGIEAQVEEFESNMTSSQNEVRQNVSNLISELSTVLEQFSSIMDNDDQTVMEQGMALRNLSDQYPEAYAVLIFAFGQFRPRRFGPRGGGNNSSEISWGSNEDFDGPPPLPGGSQEISGESSPPPPGGIGPGGPPPRPRGIGPGSPGPPMGLGGPPPGPGEWNPCGPPPPPWNPCGPPPPDSPPGFNPGGPRCPPTGPEYFLRYGTRRRFTKRRFLRNHYNSSHGTHISCRFAILLCLDSFRMKIVIAILAIVSEVLCRTIGEGYPCTVDRRPSPPRYLRNVTQTARTEYFAIVSKRNETLTQQKQEILVWAQKYGIETYDVLLFAIDQYTPVRTGPGRGDSVAVEWGPKIPNSFTGFPSSPPPTAITPPPLPDGGAPRSPILQGRNKRDVPS
ncbi:hypothetical protein GCK32_010683, partial [Trichostrongylus colubriformis]